MTDTEFLSEFRKELTEHTKQLAGQSKSIEYIVSSVDEIKGIFKDHNKQINKRIRKIEETTITTKGVVMTVTIICVLIGAIGTIMALT